MSELRGSDLRGALELVHRIGAAADRAGCRRALVRELRALIPAESAAHHEYDYERGGNDIVEDPVGFLGSPIVDGAPPLLMAHHPIAQHIAATMDTRPLKISDVSGRRRWHRNVVYDFAFRPFGLEHQLAMPMRGTGPANAGVALNRSRRDFAERERELFLLLRPHVRQAWENAKLRETVAALDHSGSTAPVGVALVDSVGRVDSLTAGAAALLASHLGVPLAPGAPLPERVAAWLQVQRGREGNGSRPLRLEPLKVASARGRLEIRLLPGESPADSTLVLEETPNGLDHDALLRHGLSPREVAVLCLVARGHTNDGIGHELTISPRTVQKHLERVHAKLGVGTRTAAVARALELSR